MYRIVPEFAMFWYKPPCFKRSTAQGGNISIPITAGQWKGVDITLLKPYSDISYVTTLLSYGVNNINDSLFITCIVRKTSTTFRSSAVGFNSSQHSDGRTYYTCGY